MVSRTIVVSGALLALCGFPGVSGSTKSSDSADGTSPSVGSPSKSSKEAVNSLLTNGNAGSGIDESTKSELLKLHRRVRKTNRLMASVTVLRAVRKMGSKIRTRRAVNEVVNGLVSVAGTAEANRSVSKQERSVARRESKKVLETRPHLSGLAKAKLVELGELFKNTEAFMARVEEIKPLVRAFCGSKPAPVTPLAVSLDELTYLMKSPAFVASLGGGKVNVDIRMANLAFKGDSKTFPKVAGANEREVRRDLFLLAKLTPDLVNPRARSYYLATMSLLKEDLPLSRARSEMLEAHQSDVLARTDLIPRGSRAAYRVSRAVSTSSDHWKAVDAEKKFLNGVEWATAFGWSSPRWFSSAALTDACNELHLETAGLQTARHVNFTAFINKHRSPDAK